MRIDTDIIPRKFTTLVGDGVNSSFTITHNLDVAYPMVSVYDAITGEYAHAGITVLSPNKVFIDVDVMNTRFITHRQWGPFRIRRRRPKVVKGARVVPGPNSVRVVVIG